MKRRMRMTMIPLQKALESHNTFRLIRLRSESTILIRNLTKSHGSSVRRWWQVKKGGEISLKCGVCNKYRIRIESSRNFSDRWIVGVKSLCTSNMRDNRKNNQHTVAMSLLMKEHMQPPVTKALQVTLLLYTSLQCIFNMHSHTMEWVAM